MTRATEVRTGMPLEGITMVERSSANDGFQSEDRQLLDDQANMPSRTCVYLLQTRISVGMEILASLVSLS